MLPFIKTVHMYKKKKKVWNGNKYKLLCDDQLIKYLNKHLHRGHCLSVTRLGPCAISLHTHETHPTI